jgi:prepilin-type processing-associated H-X9-DG protein
VSWLVQILPYIEDGNTFRHVNFSVGVYDPKNATVRGVTRSYMLCPSDSGASRSGRKMPGPGMPGAPGAPAMPGVTESEIQVGLANYAGCHNGVEAPIDAANSGVLFLNSRITTRDIPDGSSFTLMASEKKLGDADLGWMSGTRATLRNTGTLPNATLEPGVENRSRRSRPDEQPRTGDPVYVGGFGSMHPGGANYVLVDGSVRFLSETIDQPVYEALGNRADGKLMDGSF